MATGLFTGPKQAAYYAQQMFKTQTRALDLMRERERERERECVSVCVWCKSSYLTAEHPASVWHMTLVTFLPSKFVK